MVPPRRRRDAQFSAAVVAQSGNRNGGWFEADVYFRPVWLVVHGTIVGLVVLMNVNNHANSFSGQKLILDKYVCIVLIHPSTALVAAWV